MDEEMPEAQLPSTSRESQPPTTSRDASNETTTPTVAASSTQNLFGSGSSVPNLILPTFGDGLSFAFPPNASFFLTDTHWQLPHGNLNQPRDQSTPVPAPNRVQALLSRIRETSSEGRTLTQLLEVKQAQLGEAGHMKFLPGTSTDEKIMLQTAIDELLQDTKSLTELTAVTRGKPIQIEGVYSTNIHKRLASLKNYPDPSLNGDAFWKALTRHAKANGITTDNERCIHFALAIQSDSNLVTWYETTVQGRNLKIADIEDQFYQHTLSPYWLSQRLATLVGILYRPRELVRTFNVRF